jgi:diaminopimelate decarboxylase
MKTNTPPARIAQLAREFGTPLWIYDAEAIRENVRALLAFDTIRYAQKANSNIHVLCLMRDLGVQLDAVSHGEIRRALAAGFSSRDGASGIVFTADVIDDATLDLVVREQIPVNAGSIDMLYQLGAVARGHRVWLRINPGFGHGHSRKTNTGGEQSKHGIWHTDMPDALAAIQQHGLKLVGLHMHIGSGADYRHLGRVCGAMVEAARQVGQPLEAISAGGGLSVPYRDGEPRVDTAHYHGLWDTARRRIGEILGATPRLEIEPGRYLVAAAGLLVAEVRATKRAGPNRFTLVDAGFNDLVRPSMYGSFHNITVIPSDDSAREIQPTIVGGPLCESGDVFTQSEGGVVEPRPLPEARVGDLLVFHDAGAYGASMSSNYNSRPLIPEVMIDGDDFRLIRRRQTIDELMALEMVALP